jgi:Mn2+/Fe2+ NRAMP family transporter
MQFYLQAAIVEKGVRKEHLSITRMDVISGSIVTIIVMFFIIVTCAMILYPAGVRVETAGDAAQALVPLAGQYAAGLFALGLLAASLFAAAIIPLSTAFTVCEGLGWDAGIDRKIGEAPQFYFIFAATIFFSAGLILLPGIPLLAVMVVSQALNGLLLPIVVIFMLLIANNKEVMGEYRNGPILNIIGIGSAAAASIAALLLVFMTFFPAGL